MGILDALFGNNTTDKGSTPSSTGGNWDNKEPLFGTINGHEVTVVTGKDGTAREGHTLIVDGIAQKADGTFDKGGFDSRHDHFSPNSVAGDKGDRGNSHVPNT